MTLFLLPRLANGWRMAVLKVGMAVRQLCVWHGAA